MATTRQIIDYLRRCYQADNRESAITNLFQSKHRFVRFFDGFELGLSGTLPRIPLPTDFGEQVRTEVFKYRRDKSLLFAAFPIVGDASQYGRLSKSLCAPLVYFDAEIEEHEGSLWLAPALESMQVNYPVLADLASAGESDSANLDALLSQLPPAPWSREQVHVIAAMFAQLLPHVAFENLSTFPQLMEQTEVSRRCNQHQLACLPACAMALVPNSIDTRGVLYELELLAQGDPLSRPLMRLLEHTGTSSAASGKQIFAPSVLSNSQVRAVHSSQTDALSLIIGPPGTGKSHTIACIALDHLARNQTVLIASKMDQAVNVVGKKIEELIGSSQGVVRAGRKEYLRELKSGLEMLLQGGASCAPSNSITSPNLRSRLKRLDSQLVHTESQLSQRLSREMAWGELFTTTPSGWLDSLNSSLKKRWCNWQLQGQGSVIEQIDNYEAHLRLRTETCTQLLQVTLQERIARLLGKRRQDLVNFLQAIRARSDGKQQQMFQETNFRVLLSAFPIWLCKLSDLANVLPFQREIFDVAIIDEATQCDIASCLALFQRARRVVVVGDPQQLRHLSFLPLQRQEALADDCELTASQRTQFHYRDRSILDLVNDRIPQQEQIAFLNEHFRSVPQLIEFSNQQFYHGALSIMQQHPGQPSGSALQIHAIGGRRSTDSARNEGEASAVLERLAALIHQQRTGQSIGVLSPFREQVDYINSRINKHFTFEELQRHDLLVGTAHTFQGEERDIMLLSLVADDNSHAATLRFLNAPNLLNVAITRARQQQEIFTSLNRAHLDQKSLLRQYLESIETASTSAVNSASCADAPVEVVRHFQTLGMQVWCHAIVANQPLDLVIGREKFAGIDLIGFPGRFSQPVSLERYRMLRRAGLRLLPLTYRDWLQRRDTTLSRLVADC